MSAIIAALGATGCVAVLGVIGGAIKAFFEWLSASDARKAEEAKADAARGKPDAEIREAVSKGKDGIAELNRINRHEGD